MIKNRLHAFFSSSLSEGAFPQAVLPEVVRERPLGPVAISDIYQVAYERARHDYELNRLFNPEFYEDGSGI